MDPVIKQILPIPESLTAMIRCETENGKKYYFDANATGGTVLYALVEDGFGGALEFYTTDCNGIGELQEHDVDYVMLTPTIHCQKCGRRIPESHQRIEFLYDDLHGISGISFVEALVKPDTMQCHRGGGPDQGTRLVLRLSLRCRYSTYP